MLKRIYVYLENADVSDWDGFEGFCERAHGVGIDVVKMNDLVQVNGIWRQGEAGDGAGDGLKDVAEFAAMWGCDDWVLIADCDGICDGICDEVCDGVRDGICDEVCDGVCDGICEDACDGICEEGRTRVPLVGFGEGYRGRAEFVICDFDVSMEYMELVYDRLHGRAHTVAETERIVMREMTVEDLPEMYELYETLADCPFVEQLYDYEREREFTENYIKNMYGFFQYGLWLVFERNTGKLIGRVGIENREIDGETRRELGYLIHADYRRRGYAYESCVCAIEYARTQLEATELFICVPIGNEPSEKLAEKLGFVPYAREIDGMNLYRRYFTD